MNPTDENSSEPAQPTYRSRWGRFSPAMGWKSFCSEIVIVVLGVLIALAANEAVQNWNWRNKVQDGEIRLRGDMEYLFALSAEQYSIGPCAQEQLTELSHKLVQSGSNWSPVTVHVGGMLDLRFVIRIPSRQQQFPVWDSLVADGTAARFPQKREAMYGVTSSRVTRAQNLNDEANQLGRRLLALGHPMVLTDDTRRYFLVMTEEMRAIMALATLNASQRMVSIAEFGIAPQAKQVDAYLEESGTVQFCKAQGLPLADWRDALKPEGK